MYFYKAFGLHIASDLPMVELISLDKAAVQTVDVLIQAADLPLNLDASGDSPHIYGKQQQLFLDVRTVARFFIADGNRIIYRRETDTDDDNLRLFILGSCMGAILQQRGYVVLHGNAVSIDGNRCSLFVGHTGAGKSTLAARYFLQGAYILADDVCAISVNQQGSPLVIPSYPQIKLWQDSADLLGIDTQGLRRIRREDKKFALKIDQQFFQQPLLLTDIIELQSDEKIISTACVSGFEKIKKLIEHSYRYYFLQHMSLSPDYVKLLFKLMNVVEFKMMCRSQVTKNVASII